MKRIAFFVEGLSEQLFVEKLLTEILGENSISIEKQRMRGGSKVPISIVQIGKPDISNDAEYYFIIVDCGSETTVASYIKEQRNSLIKNGYLAIFGLLDVRPNWSRTDLPKLNKLLYYGLPQKNLETKFIFSIMEIEAWYLAEENHYANIDPMLTIQHIKNTFSFDPLSDTEEIDEPTNLLNNIYNSAGLTYGKDKRRISRTVNNLDYANLYFNVRKRNKSFNNLIDLLSSFL